MPNPSTVTVTHSMVILDQSNTVYTVQGSNVRMTFIGGSNDVVNFSPHSANGQLVEPANDKVVAVDTTNFGLSGADTANLQVFVAGFVDGMQIGGWGNFDTTIPKFFLLNEGNYKVSINNLAGTGLISGLDGQGLSRNGSISFFDSASLRASQIVGIPSPHAA
jgi:hypothetical protein